MYPKWDTLVIRPKRLWDKRSKGDMRMDRTSITLGSETRTELREYKRDRDLPNYDAALRDLLDGGPS